MLEDKNISSYSRSSNCFEKPHAQEDILEQKRTELEDMFTVSADMLKTITQDFIQSLKDGLEKKDQTVPMFPAFVFGWPTGKETGHYLSLDLGGTNLRVCLVDLKGDGKFDITQSKFRLTDEQKHQDGKDLFDFCAKCVKDFVNKHFGSSSSIKDPISLGFTFSYPMVQEKIDHGKLVRWTKGFDNPNTEGKDCAEMLRASLKRFDVPVHLTSIINDTTGTLIASNYVSSDSKIACIFGTGCNAAYMEHVSNIPKLKGFDIPEDTDMAINCEYGAFGSYGSPVLEPVRTKYDEYIDSHSNKPSEQMYEKMISGMYLGEIFRLILCDLVDDGVLFLGQNTYKIEKPFVFDTAFLSLIESDPTDELLTVMGLFSYFFNLDTEIKERLFFRRVAQLIGLRSARLSACGISAIALKMGYDKEGCHVGCDGSLYSKYPGFADRLHEALVDIIGEGGRKIHSRQAEDGSGAGSAVIAAMTKARKEAGHIAHR
ncbi:hexokinase [Malassezia vespertilionis]|uniref:Phosphotransferase n=1 Tax=Malassezia vespertilionis TaxID=2020962 RepID=A0A2N1J9E1_9BASI|nr:hexokinase [Malassezia vespertilionis]PKI83102.1 Hxk1p [Malassezia vespertilionis]WFD07531.1 hexokinase [Malassezia vespertilionis]